ncbi:MAG: hypothetical protein OXI33_00970 [Chloroflexota bacterium]|nr:hypothetical protein [Chloroflexota bacterium]
MRRVVLGLVVCVSVLVGCGGSPSLEERVAAACQVYEEMSPFGATGYTIFAFQQAQDAGYSGDAFLEEMRDQCFLHQVKMLRMWQLMRSGER